MTIMSPYTENGYIQLLRKPEMCFNLDVAFGYTN